MFVCVLCVYLLPSHSSAIYVSFDGVCVVILIILYVVIVVDSFVARLRPSLGAHSIET